MPDCILPLKDYIFAPRSVHGAQCYAVHGADDIDEDDDDEDDDDDTDEDDDDEDDGN